MRAMTFEITSERAGQLIRCKLFGEGREVFDVGEHDRNLGQFASQDRLGFASIKPANEIDRNVFAHRAHGRFRFLETFQDLAHVAK